MEKQKTDRWALLRRARLAKVVSSALALTLGIAAPANAAEYSSERSAVVSASSAHSSLSSAAIAKSKNHDPALTTEYTMVNFSTISRPKLNRVASSLGKYMQKITDGWTDVVIKQIDPTPNMVSVYQSLVPTGCSIQDNKLVSEKLLDNNVDSMFGSGGGVIAVTNTDSCDALSVARGMQPGNSIDYYGKHFIGLESSSSTSIALKEAGMVLTHEYLHNAGLGHYSELKDVNNQNLTNTKLPNRVYLDINAFNTHQEYADSSRCNIMGLISAEDFCKHKITKLNKYQKYQLAMNGYLSFNEATLMDLKSNHGVKLKPGGDKFGAYYFKEPFALKSGVVVAGFVVLSKIRSGSPTFELCYLGQDGDIISIGTPIIPRPSTVDISMSGLNIKIKTSTRGIKVNVVGDLDHSTP